VAEQAAGQVAAAHYRQQQITVRQTAETAQAIWGSVSIAALDDSWRAAGPLLVAAVADGQRSTAAPADAYVTAALAAGGAATDPGGSLNIGAFAGRAADGRSLTSLLYEPWIETRWRLAAGQTGPEAMRGGLATLIRQVGTEVPDAGREAVGASLAGNRAASGYVRMLTPPSCARCIVLAGKHYRYSTGFQRHPRCDCVHLPVAGHSGGHALVDPDEYFHGLGRAEQDRIFTAAGAQAIRDGADMASVVNARRGMHTAEAYGQRLASTYDSTTKRGQFFRAERRRAIDRGLIPPSGRGFRLMTPRLLPEEIYKRAGNRDELIAMLRRYGYIH
jgi:hypothetical protein